MSFLEVAADIISIDDLGLPKSVHEFTTKPRGIVLVTGPTGSGKSTSLAAMIDQINRTRSEHILTVEDPIEFVHRHKRCIVNQREIGPDATSFANALKAALRQDPDVILVGEMRDLETISTALTAAETGHLVFGTLHTQSAPSTIDRIVDVFPPEQQEQVRIMIAGSLQAVVTQTLLPTADGAGRVAALEILLPDDAVRNLIRQAKVEQVYSVMQTNTARGMQTMEQSLADLAARRVISVDAALSRSSRPDQLIGILERSGFDVAGELARSANGPARPHVQPQPAPALRVAGS
jgi:twitching motility protein PilT